ncbi:sensor histidine kinase [Blautia sp. OM07-19]|nr:sensor histidine kinase [Blautia sp. OM07-19]
MRADCQTRSFRSWNSLRQTRVRCSQQTVTWRSKQHEDRAIIWRYSHDTGFKKKFILVAMLSTMLVLTAIMGVVNFSNYREMLDRADEMTALLEQNDGKFPEEPSRHEQDDTETPPAKPENDEKDKSRFSVETPFETRYFTVTVDENGEVTDCDLDRIAAVDEETAEEYTQTAQQKNKTTGFQGIYRYRVTETEDGAKYVFLLVVIFSRMVFRPVEESIQKQKRFITDASHELKTPLTIIDANTEVMEMESGESQYHGREQKWQRINDYRYLIKKDQRRKNTRWTNCPPGIFSFY